MFKSKPKAVKKPKPKFLLAEEVAKDLNGRCPRCGELKHAPNNGCDGGI